MAVCKQHIIIFSEYGSISSSSRLTFYHAKRFLDVVLPAQVLAVVRDMKVPVSVSIIKRIPTHIIYIICPYYGSTHDHSDQYRIQNSAKKNKTVRGLVDA